MRLTSVTAAVVLGFACCGAQADGLADLKSALGRMQAQGGVPLKASIEAKTVHRIGEGKSATEDTGSASIAVEDSATGLRLFYGKDMLARLDSEAQALVANPNARTPTTNAAREFTPNDLRPMIGAASVLGRTIERASFKGEKTSTYDGKPARQLSFSVPVETLSDRQRKYIKEFTGGFDVWIGADGMPLASRLQINASGRAFLVVGFDFAADEQAVYTQSGGRLLTARHEALQRQSGAGENSLRRTIKTLHVND
jgi:hypothetical protein